MMRVMWGHDTQPEPGDSADSLSAQLLDACAAVRRQIELQRAVRYSRGGGHGGDDIAVDALQAQLDQLEQALADLTPRDG